MVNVYGHQSVVYKLVVAVRMGSICTVVNFSLSHLWLVGTVCRFQRKKFQHFFEHFFPILCWICLGKFLVNSCSYIGSKQILDMN